MATALRIRSLAVAIGGSTILHIAVGLRTETGRQPIGLVVLRAAIRWPIDKQVPGNNSVAKVATWLAIEVAGQDRPIEAALARAIEPEVVGALATGPEAVGQIVSGTAISHAVLAEIGTFLGAGAGDTTDLDLAVAAVAAHPAWGLEEASVVAEVGGGAGR
jgi:hypothetical protein